jgi:hypothetical protein
MSEAELQARSTKDMQKHACRRNFVRTFSLDLEMRPVARRRSSWPLQRRRARQRLQRLPRNRAGGVPPGQSKMLGLPVLGGYLFERWARTEESLPVA